MRMHRAGGGGSSVKKLPFARRQGRFCVRFRGGLGFLVAGHYAADSFGQRRALISAP